MEGAYCGHVGIIDDEATVRTEHRAEGFIQPPAVACYERGSVSEFNPFVPTVSYMIQGAFMRILSVNMIGNSCKWQIIFLYL